MGKNSSDEYTPHKICDVSFNIISEEYIRELERNSKTDSKISIVLAFSGLLVLYLINFLDFNPLFSTSNSFLSEKKLYLFQVLCSILQVSMLIVYLLSLYLLIKCLRTRNYRLIATLDLIDEKLLNESDETIKTYMAVKMQDAIDHNCEINNQRNRQYNRAILYLVSTIVLLLLCQIIRLNILGMGV